MKLYLSALCLSLIVQNSPALGSPVKNKKQRATSTNPAARPQQEKTKPVRQEVTSTVVEISDTSPDEVEIPSTKPIDRLFRNPVLAAGLSSGVDAINRSIDTLMESLFYNLLDNKLKWPLTGSAGVNLAMTRDVYNARDGAYVVVDRFGLGPDFTRELYRYNDIPVTLGAQQFTDVYDIYLRTDPMRVSENKVLPLWRVAINNWFGVLPILEAILPPSFNANEMYDPLNRIQTPFTFPLSVDAAGAMDIGSIKSYSINGGINLGVEGAQGIHGFKDQVMTGRTALEMKLPYTIFRTGEYRINVLKKDSNTVWVGVVDSNRLGHRIESRLGKTYFLLSKTIPLWRGMPAVLFPVDLAIEEAIGDLFSRVYSFDLRNDEAKTAFVEAVHGNFAAAQISWLRFREEKKETGVNFFYTKQERRFETSISTGHNVFLTSKRTNRTHSDAEIEINDSSGRYYILEAKEDADQRKWDILTGRAESNITLQADLMVRKVIEKSTEGAELKTHFEFLAEGNPIDISFNLSINDKFVETEDLQFYLNQLSRFSLLKIDGLPQFQIRDPEALIKRRKEVFFSNDSSFRHRLHITPTHLGQFEGYASVRMSYAQMMAVAKLPRVELWKRFCRVFEVSDEETCLLWEKSLLWRNIYRMGGIFTKPLRLIDYRITAADTVDEIEDAIAALKEFEKELKPKEKQEALRSLFATEYPMERVEALLHLSDISQIPRSVEIQTKPKGYASDEIKDKFKRMDGHRFTSERAFPPPARYDTTKETETKFDPANLTFAGAKPRLKKITLYKDTVSRHSKPLDSANGEKPTIAPILVSRIAASKIGSADHLRVYVKLEQTGRIQLAKFKLFEEVVDVPLPSESVSTLPDRANFLIKLSGPQSLLTNVVSEESLSAGGAFRLTIAISSNGIIWSDEKSLEFRVEAGELRSP